MYKIHNKFIDLLIKWNKNQREKVQRILDNMKDNRKILDLYENMWYFEKIDLQ